jgi:hypothetical protein
MYDLLAQKLNLNLDRVVVIHPCGHAIQDGFALIKETMESKYHIIPEPELLHFEDADSLQRSCVFLQRLYKLLYSCEQQGTSVYLSLAGGRKSMAAMMAWVAPFFSCVKGLYHVVDEDKDRFPSLYEILNMSPSSRALVMCPPLEQLDRLVLVDIPWERGQRISESWHQQLLSNLPRDFDRLEDFEQMEAIIAGQIIVQDEAAPQVRMTGLAFQQFQAIRRRDLRLAQQLRLALLTMHEWVFLRAWVANGATVKYRVLKRPSVTLRQFQNGFPSSVRPVFYTIPETDDMSAPVEQLVICSLEEPDATGQYRYLKEIKDFPHFSLQVEYNGVPPVPSPASSILIVPLGKSPMVATQLYTLLKEREQRTIHEVVLIYPQHAAEIFNAVRMVRDALQETGDMVLCTQAFVPGLADILNSADCLKYQQCLEDEITRVQQTYPDCKIDLALSGGRKGMTAMTLFAARNRDIPYVFHTLIKDDKLSDLIEEQTTLQALNQQPYERNGRLLLRDPAYREGEAYPYEKFELFRVPVALADD